MSRNLLCAVVAIVALTVAGTAQAALVAYDGFSTSTYTPGSELLNGTNGGTGWSAAFTTADTVQTGQAYLTEQATGLTYGNLVTTPGSAVIGTNPYYTGDRYLSAGAQSSGTLYMSLLVDITNYSSSLGPDNFNLAQSNGSSNNYLAGINAQWSSNYWRIFERSGSSTNYLTASTVAPTGNVTHLLVEKITFNTSANLDTVSIFIDPALAAEPAATATCSLYDIGTPDHFDWLSFSTGTIIDEIRVGTTWGDVTPTTPEPSTLALLAAGLLGLLAYAWRKRR